MQSDVRNMETHDQSSLIPKEYKESTNEYFVDYTNNWFWLLIRWLVKMLNYDQ